MARTTVFDDVLLDGIRSGQVPARTKEAREWFRQKARNIRGQRRDAETIIANQPGQVRMQSGRMLAYIYDAKHKKKLPYFDRFPVIFMVKRLKGGWHGINLHYLPPKMRAVLMDELYNIRNNDRWDETTKLKVSYEMLKGAERFKYFKPCFKHYLKSHVKSRIIEIPVTDWDVALWLPNERFNNLNRRKIWEDSKRIIRGERATFNKPLKPKHKR